MDKRKGEKMASINGLTVKKLKYFEGREGTAAQGNLYLGNKKIAFWSQDADGCVEDNLDMEPGYSETRLRQAIIAAHPEKHEEKVAQNGIPYTLDYELEFLMTDLLSLMETEKAWKRAVDMPDCLKSQTDFMFRNGNFPSCYTKRACVQWKLLRQKFQRSNWIG
jgi:hypothetical protein